MDGIRAFARLMCFAVLLFAAWTVLIAAVLLGYNIASEAVSNIMQVVMP